MVRSLQIYPVGIAKLYTLMSTVLQLGDTICIDVMLAVNSGLCKNRYKVIPLRYWVCISKQVLMGAHGTNCSDYRSLAGTPPLALA